MAALNTALKEWAIAVAALARGETILLLRKGGIREHQGRFTVAAEQVLLYPTYEHQQAALLKPPYPDQLHDHAMPADDTAVALRAWAHITDVHRVQDAAIVRSLLPFHIWTDAWVTDRLGWKPKSPLYLLLLRVYQLPQPVNLPLQPEYGGCRSWIDLRTEVDIAGAVPVLSDADYQLRSQAIHGLLEPTA